MQKLFTVGVLWRARLYNTEALSGVSNDLNAREVKTKTFPDDPHVKKTTWESPHKSPAGAAGIDKLCPIQTHSLHISLQAGTQTKTKPRTEPRKPRESTRSLTSNQDRRWRGSFPPDIHPNRATMCQGRRQLKHKTIYHVVSTWWY